MGSGHILSLSLLPTVTHTLATIDAKVITFIFATIKQPQRPSFPPVNHSSTSKMPPQMDDTTNDNEMSNTEMQPELSARLVNDQGQIRRRPTADEDRVSNGYVLGVAFYSFLGFTILQTGYAFKAKSAAMLADSEAMFVDAGTYLCNMLAERLKNRDFTEAELALPVDLRQHRRKLHRLYLELVPPFISVATLLVVTFTTMQMSILTIMADETVEDPNLKIMLFFSALNLVLDVVNVSCFAKANQAVLTPIDFDKEISSAKPAVEATALLSKQENATYASETYQGSTIDQEGDVDDLSDDGLVNLNMCSAWTHVFADTLRSVAVLIAAGIAYVSDFITPGEADAYAALVVSFIILLSCVPLMQGLFHTAREIREMHQSPIPEVILSV